MDSQRPTSLLLPHGSEIWMHFIKHWLMLNCLNPSDLWLWLLYLLKKFKPLIGWTTLLLGLWLAGIDIQRMTDSVRDHDQFLSGYSWCSRNPVHYAKHRVLLAIMAVPRVTPSHPTLVFTPFSVVSVGPSHVELVRMFRIMGRQQIKAWSLSALLLVTQPWLEKM